MVQIDFKVPKYHSVTASTPNTKHVFVL